MQDYRSADAGTNVSSVTYFPNGRAGRVLWPLLLVAIFLVTIAMGVGSTRGVRLRCDHASTSCNVESQWPIGSSSVVFPIA
jgi:hypothetical protein